MNIEKVTLNWKAPSERKMADFVKQFDDEKKKAFALACIEVKDGKGKVNKAKAKKWLVKEFDNTDYIVWEGRPEKKEKRMSSVDEISMWLDL